MDQQIDFGCEIKTLPQEFQLEAAANAIAENPINAVPMIGMMTLLQDVNPYYQPEPGMLAVAVSKFWGAKGVSLTVGFMEPTPSDLQNRILLHANAWGKYGNVKFSLTATDPQVRISRGPGGYFSFLGVDILSIPRNQQTMNLEAFTMATPEREFTRVVRHEFGHTLAAEHEHLRRELIQRLDVQKTIEYFRRTQGWSEQTTRQQVLRPLQEVSIRGTPTADQDSIMAYALPSSITIDGQPIRGGADIDALDAQFIATLYPKPGEPPVPPSPPPPPPGPPPPPNGGDKVTVTLQSNQVQTSVVLPGYKLVKL